MPSSGTSETPTVEKLEDTEMQIQKTEMRKDNSGVKFKTQQGVPYVVCHKERLFPKPFLEKVIY